MSRYRFTPQAEEDLFEIWSYIARDNRPAADRVERAIHEACALLADSPLRGRVRTDLTSLPVRFWILPRYRSYFIVYDPETDPLQIVRVLHAARNIPAILDEQ